MAEHQTRKLAVVLHADVVGSTALVQRNETVAHERIRDAFRRLSESIAAYGGVAHEIRGDALVAEFARASDATCAALVFQQANAEHNARLGDDMVPEVRVGIALGEEVFADDTVTGSGVVLAQRLEQLAEAGGVVIQGAASETVPQRMPFDFESLGEQKLKGFDQPVRAYSVSLRAGATVPEPERRHAPGRASFPRLWVAGAVVAALVALAGVLAWWQSRQPQVEPASVERTALPLPDKPSIAVLPFTNMSGDPKQEYFVDGMAEDLITGLSRFGGLFVVARNSSFTYKGKNVDVKQVGRELGVRYVLEGSLRRSGDQIRVNAQLIDTATGGHVWAEQFDREVTDVFAIQDEITERIVGAIGAIGGGRGKLQRAELERVSQKPTESLQAYDYFLRGIAHIDRLTKEDNLEARRLFNEATELDPDYARAFGQLAWTYMVDFYMGFDEAAESSLQKARELAQKAIAVDPTDPWPHWALGAVHYWQGEIDQSVARYEKALALNPNAADILAEFGFTVSMIGDAARGVSLIRRAMRLNPYFPEWYSWNLGIAQYAAREYESAIKALSVLTIEDVGVHTWLAASYAQAGRSSEASAEVQKLLNAKPDLVVEDAISGYMAEAVRKHYIDGLRKAGVPED